MKPRAKSFCNPRNWSKPVLLKNCRKNIFMGVTMLQRLKLGTWSIAPKKDILWISIVVCVIREVVHLTIFKFHFTFVCKQKSIVECFSSFHLRHWLLLFPITYGLLLEKIAAWLVLKTTANWLLLKVKTKNWCITHVYAKKLGSFSSSMFF